MAFGWFRHASLSYPFQPLNPIFSWSKVKGAAALDQGRRWDKGGKVLVKYKTLHYKIQRDNKIKGTKKKEDIGR